MSARQQYRTYTIQQNNMIELAAGDSRATFRKLWVYPGAPQTSGGGAGTLSQNAAKLLIGIDGDGPRVARDTLNPTDIPILYEAPEVNGTVEPMDLRTILVYGTAGDSIFLVWWS